MARRSPKVLIVTLVLAFMPTGSQAIPGDHLVGGLVRLQDGIWFGVSGSSAPTSQLAGRAWLGRDDLASPVEIALDCLVVAWHLPVYPIPPYLPYHVVHASGFGTDGHRYFITAFDLAPDPVGFGDRVGVVTEPGGGPCAADPGAAEPIAAGDIAVLA